MSTERTDAKQPDSLIVQRLRLSTELSQNITERGHTLSGLTHLVLRYGVLDVREDKVLVQVGRTFVILDSLVKGVGHEVD